MPKGYWLARLDIDNEAEYAEYRKLNSIAFTKYKARFLVRGTVGENIFGTPRKHNVVIEFESYDQAVACYRSPEYQAAKQHLAKVGATDLVIVAGYDGPQP
jgi:uncharacterized protein (DUF1330 family)